MIFQQLGEAGKVSFSIAYLPPLRCGQIQSDDFSPDFIPAGSSCLIILGIALAGNLVSAVGQARRRGARFAPRIKP
jgi:hypothetical protein